MNAFTKRFRKLQHEKGWTIAVAAKHLGVSNETISTYRRGTTPNFKYLSRIAKAFGVSLEYLVTGTEKKAKTVVDFDSFKRYYASASAAEKSRIAGFLEEDADRSHVIR